MYFLQSPYATTLFYCRDLPMFYVLSLPSIFLTVLSVQCFAEIINIGYNVYKMDNLPWFRSMSWYFLIGKNETGYFIAYYPIPYLPYLLLLHTFQGNFYMVVARMYLQSIQTIQYLLLHSYYGTITNGSVMIHWSIFCSEHEDRSKNYISPPPTCRRSP